KDGKLTTTMPAFDSYATFLGLTNSDPLIGLEFSGVPRGAAGLLEVTPNAHLKVKATVWNPSPQKLAPGTVKLFTATGWFSNETEQKIGAIEPYSSQEVSFEIVSPAICSKRNLHPIVLKYQSGKTTSTPATELVWWTNPVTPISGKVATNKK
ncbi:MAG: hypothetical protein ABI443_05615, partial [Chthoniobacterales bacterium]